MSAPGHSNKAVIAAMTANGVIAVAKFVGFLLTRSSSMLAESIHSVADTGNQALLLLGGHKAQQHATDTHQFGYGRERYFWSFVVALVIFLLGSVFAIYEGIEKIRHPEEIHNPAIALGILVFGILAEGSSFRTAVKTANPLRKGRSWLAFIRHSKVPELPVVLLEDFGAILGLILALGAIITSMITDNPIWDGIGTLSIGILLGVIAIILVVEMKSLLIGESADNDEMNTLIASIESVPKVNSLIHIRTQYLGPDELLVGAKVEFIAGLTVVELTEAIDEVEAAIRAKIPIARPCYIEPDIMDPSMVGPDDD